VYECQECGAVEFAFNSCRNRHCPKCQKFAKAQWVAAQKVWQLPIPYFHIVFTIDHAVNAWLPANRKVVYDLLFQTATATLQAFAAEALEGELGITAALHTWSQVLLGHAHLHCIVTGGALSADGKTWTRSQPNYLFDIEAVSAAFRDKFCAGLRHLAEQGKLAGVTAAEAQAVTATMAGQAWEVFIKPFEKPDTVVNYLSRYIHAVAISNYRLTYVGNGEVRFTYHDNRDEGQEKELTLTTEEFTRSGRFIWHVLPDGFWRIRHFGLHAGSTRKRKLARARQLLGLTAAAPKGVKLDLSAWLDQVLGEGQRQRCHWCGAYGRRAYRGEAEDVTWLWLWLKILFGMVFGAAWRGAYAGAAAPAY
jgi:hypothetical protein